MFGKVDFFSFNSRSDHPFEEVVIALVGKYTKFEDSYMSVIKALKHSVMACRKTLVVKVKVFVPDNIVNELYTFLLLKEFLCIIMQKQFFSRIFFV